jgi:hypothetical protein
MLLGRETEVKYYAEKIVRIDPKFSTGFQGIIFPFKDEAYVEHYVDALRKAGLS